VAERRRAGLRNLCPGRDVRVRVPPGVRKEGWPSGNGTGLLNRGWGWRPTRVRSARLPLRGWLAEREGVRPETGGHGGSRAQVRFLHHPRMERQADWRRQRFRKSSSSASCLPGPTPGLSARESVPPARQRALKARTGLAVLGGRHLRFPLDGHDPAGRRGPSDKRVSRGSTPRWPTMPG
jgi:hypothetical protein